MASQKDKKIKKKTIGILVVVAVCIAVIAMNSYAFWSITATQSGTNIVGSGCFDLDFEEGDAINLGSQFPISDTDSETLSPYTFTITNTCSIYSRYQVNLEVVTVQGAETKLADQYVKVSLNNNYKEILANYEEVTPTISGAIKSYKLISGELAEDESITYDLREWLEENTPLSEGQNKSFRSKILVTGEPTVEYYYLANESIPIPTDLSEIFNANSIFMSLLINTADSPSRSMFWGGPITKGSVETMSFTTTNEVPAGVIGSWDAGLKKNGKVMAWYTDSDANSKYEVVVGANGGVYAPENSSSLFVGFSSLVTLNLTNLDTSQVTNMLGMFMFTGLGSKLDNDTHTGDINVGDGFTLDLGDKFDTSNVTNMWGMFMLTSIVGGLDLGDNFDTSKVTNMSGMFFAVGFHTMVLDVEPILMSFDDFILSLGDKFDTSNVTDMTSMFLETGSGNPNFTLDLKKFSVSSTTLTDAFTFNTGNASHTLYASNSNIDFISDTGKGFTGTIINCTTSPTSCP